MGTFNDYLKYGIEEDAGKQTRIIDEKLKLSEESVEAIKNIGKEIKILAVAEVYCPDCRAVVSFTETFARLNSGIKVEYISKEEAKSIELTRKVERIPALFNLTDGKGEIFLNEFPNAVQKKMKADPENFDEIKTAFRLGKYNSEIENELVKYFTEA